MDPFPIMRAFVSLRRMLAGNQALARKLAELERRLEGHNASIRSLSYQEAAPYPYCHSAFGNRN